MKKATIIKGLAKQVGFQIDEKTTPKASGKATSSTYCVYLGKWNIPVTCYTNSPEFSK